MIDQGIKYEMGDSFVPEDMSWSIGLSLFTWLIDEIDVLYACFINFLFIVIFIPFSLISVRDSLENVIKNIMHYNQNLIQIQFILQQH